MAAGADFIACMRDGGVDPALVELLDAVAGGAERVEALVRRTALANLTGLTGGLNVQGEAVHKLDIAGNEVFVEMIRATGRVAVLVSEELPAPLPLGGGPFVLYLDPIDGSSSIDVNGSVGSIFSVHTEARGGLPGPGRGQRAAGYVMYGPGTALMVTWGRGLNEFMLDPASRRFRLTRPALRLPARGRTYAVNEGRRAYWSPRVRALVEDLTADDPERDRPYSLRYSGSLTADFHRILTEGGLYCYPADSQAPDGKLRLLYEACPLALVAEAAGGCASTGRQRILDLVPRAIHQRVPLFIGGAAEVELAERYLGDEGERP